MECDERDDYSVKSNIEKKNYKNIVYLLAISILNGVLEWTHPWLQHVFHNPPFIVC